MSELVKVIVRCRPRNEKEEKLKCQVRKCPYQKYQPIYQLFFEPIEHRENRGWL